MKTTYQRPQTINIMLETAYSMLDTISLPISDNEPATGGGDAKRASDMTWDDPQPTSGHSSLWDE